jgi:hypothetical protein
MTNMTKETHSAKALLEESLRNASASIPLDLWGAVAIRALHEAKPVQEILLDALGDYLKKSCRNLNGDRRPRRRVGRAAQ